MKVQNQYRQGDVLVQPCDGIPKGVKRVKVPNGRIVLAEGEATGHAHVLETKSVEVYAKGGTMYLKVIEAAPLKHEEHGTITVEPRTYVRIGQREWSDAEQSHFVGD